MTRAILTALAMLAAEPTLPPRPAGAPDGTTFARSIADLSLVEREGRIVDAILAGNVPDRLRSFVPIAIKRDGHELTIEVAPDYLSVGNDPDAFLVPLSPISAQRVADRLGCLLPTVRLEAEIHRAAPVKLEPRPIPPSPEMTTVPVFLKHSDIVREQRAGVPAGSLVAGHKKDVVISARLAQSPGKVAIEGWRRPDGKPIQPLYLGHTAAWVDYSHGVRLVRDRAILDGKPTTLSAILKDPTLCSLASDEGPIPVPRYVAAPSGRGLPARPGETYTELKFDPGVRAVVNQAAATRGRPVLVVFYALPNGNTIEWTAGRRTKAGDDFHFDIQHIAAQTRFMRERLPERDIVLIYLENNLKSWPAWRRAGNEGRIPEIIQALRDRFGKGAPFVLNGHSGGGSFICGYMNTQAVLPDDLERIAFLDSNYAYETDRHRDKLAAWLKASDRHRLCVLAYEDHVALLNGKTFVSAQGGTWGRSAAMVRDLTPIFPLRETRAGNMRRLTGLDGRILFHLLENPEKKIHHTTQVEKNGFIESMLCGTKHHEVGYAYFGDRAYDRFIDDPTGPKP